MGFSVYFIRKTERSPSMNRRQRRATQGLGSGTGRPDGTGQNEAMALFTRGVEHQRAGELGPAVRSFRRVLELVPDHVAACDRLAAAYLAQGKHDKASEQFAELARMAPQVLAQFGKVLDTLKALLPELATALADAAVSPEIATTDVQAIVANPYFRIVLEQATVCDAALERWLTALRASILRAVVRRELPAGGGTLAFCSALAQQCFINEYVFFAAPDEAEMLATLRTLALEQIDAGVLLALAMYHPLHELAGADALAARSWPAPVTAVVRQQIIEPREETALRGVIPHLTPIADGITAQVRQQYEENPYPRWAVLAAPPWPTLLLDEHLRRLFPTGPFRPTGHEESLDILVAGCGTGRHVLELAQSYRGARVLAIDLSLASLAHAKRRTPPRLADKVEFAQADIMLLGSALGSPGRSFDLINAGGVFHHMPDPWAGWREIVKLMKPDGVMQVGLYSAHARRDIVTARQLIAERGYQPTTGDIRRMRHDLAVGGDNFTFMRLDDYFTVSTCRDLLFHVHEVQTTIPEIKAFLADNGLRFVGFDFGAPEAQEHYRNLFSRNGWSLGDLDRWDAFERENPQLFAGMYVFWVQKL
jgi:SAM-dependent methyltransferase/tetratricopeptide (TPR) repeat protein